MSDDAIIVLNWGLHKQSRTSAVKSLWENEDFLDVTIACDDDQINAHKVILSAASPFFQTILKRNPHSHPLLYLRGTKKKDIKSLLDFIYSGETCVPQEDLEDFMALAKSFQVKGLVGGEMGSTEKTDVDLIQNDSLIDERKRAKNPISKEKEKQEKTRVKNEILLDTRNEEIHSIVEISENVSDIESFNKDIMEKNGSYKSSEPNDSFQYHDASNTSDTEYDEKVMELVGKAGHDWICTLCPYKGNHKGHVKEHVQEHIEGFSHLCEYCDHSA